jgi:hypothetical protein
MRLSLNFAFSQINRIGNRRAVQLSCCVVLNGVGSPPQQESIHLTDIDEDGLNEIVIGNSVGTISIVKVNQ